MVDWLLVGALREEVQPVVDALDDAQVFDRRTVCGHLRGVRVAVLRCGVGPEAAQTHTQSARRALRPQRVLSFGTCGSLDNNFPIGTVLAVNRVSRAGGPWEPLPALGESLAVALVTVERPAWNEEDATPLRAQGAQACDMEAAAVLAASADTPTHALKVVSDIVGVSKPPRLLPGGVPHPADLLSFKRLARQLTHDALLPVLQEAVYSTSSGT